MAASIRNHRLECYAYPGIGPPYRVAVTTSAFQHDIETCRNAERCGDLQMAPVSEIFLTVQSSLGALSLKTIEALFNTRLRGAVRLSFMAAFRL